MCDLHLQTWLRWFLRLSWTVLPSLISRAKAGDFHCFGVGMSWEFFCFSHCGCGCLDDSQMGSPDCRFILGGCIAVILATFQGLIVDSYSARMKGENLMIWVGKDFSGCAIGLHDTSEL